VTMMDTNMDMPALDADNTNPTPTFDVSVTKCTHPTFGILRVVMRDGEPWFVAGDVCKTLEIENPRDATQRLDADEKNTVVLSDGIRGNPNKTIISEAGLYSLVLSSRKPEAKAFKRWVTHDILPSIRKHGAYMTPEAVEAMLADPDVMIQTLQTLKAERQARQQAELAVAAAQVKIEADAPKVEFADAVMESKTNLTFKEFSTLLCRNNIPMGELRLFDYMRGQGYLTTQPPRNLPTARALTLGVLATAEKVYKKGSDKVVVPYLQTQVTPRGQKYFMAKLLKRQRDRLAYETALAQRRLDAAQKGGQR